MAENRIRSNKVIREFNISLERVVEFLSNKGHDIKNIEWMCHESDRIIKDN